MAGHMGSETVKVENLEVIRVDLDKKLLLVKGSVPGAKTGFVKVYLSHKKNVVNKKVLAEVAQAAPTEEKVTEE
jgi:large subunit ribosomal protein L3